MRSSQLYELYQLHSKANITCNHRKADHCVDIGLEEKVKVSGQVPRDPYYQRFNFMAQIKVCIWGLKLDARARGRGLEGARRLGRECV